jgi:hypothetical protein
LQLPIYCFRGGLNLKNDNLYQYFGGKKERVFRVLLSPKYKNVTSYKVAKLADTNYSWVHTILNDLENENLVKGCEVLDIKKMYLYWAKHPFQMYTREYNVQNPKDVLKNVKMEYAFTGYFAENLIGHFLFPRFFEFYIRDNDVEKWDKYLKKSGYYGKGNVKIYFTDQHVFFEKHTVEDWPVVSIQQLIVDLIREGAECREAADILIKRIYGA